MKFLPLHIKTAILASVVSLAVLLVGFIVFSASFASQFQDEQKELAALHAENLAKQLAFNHARFNAEELRNITNIVSGARPNLFNVRVWQMDGDNFVEGAASDDSIPNEILSEDVQNALKGSVDGNSIKLSQEGDDASLFRVFSPIVENGQVTGAVEAVEKLETIWSITLRYAANLSWIMLATVAFMTAAFYFLFQKTVYQPLENLLGGIELAETGDLSVKIEEEKRPDEFGMISRKFNSMMAQIRGMTFERERQNEILKEKVSEATVELVRKNEQLETASLELFRASRKMTEMERLAAAGQTAAGFAHEVGTPLNIINGHAQLLKKILEKESKAAERVGIISEQIRCIEKIVREMLDRTRFGSLTLAPLDLNDLLRRFFSAVEPTMTKRKIVLMTDLAEYLPVISGDADRLQQVFLNLFNNALDALPEGGSLAISTENEGAKVFVEFADNGTGMSEATRTHIFQPMFTTKGRGRGTGLGLAVVKQILDEHGAEIHASSETGAGTTFYLTFPAI